MDIRAVFFIVGTFLILGSWNFGDWAIWVGGPLMFMGIILHFIDKE